MIKQFRARVMVDPRGKIKTGMKARTSEGKEYPKSLDYFNIGAFPELLEAYGEKPTAFVVKFPSDELNEFFDCNFEHWGGRKGEDRAGTLIRRCDGEVCIHRINETIDGKSYAAGEETPCICEALDEKDKQRCKYSAYLKAWIVLPQTGKIDNPMCYLFETHSPNSGDTIMSALNDVQILTGGVLRGIPFTLSVKMVSGKEDAKQKFPIWKLLPIQTVTQMRARELTEQVVGARRILETGEREGVQWLKNPQALEDPVVKESQTLFERYVPEIKNVVTVAKLTELRKELEVLVGEGKLIQTDYDKLLDVMKAKFEAINKERGK